MKTETWLAINSNGSVRTRKTKPALYIDEIAIKINVEVPDALFSKPHLEASITVPKEAAMQDVLTADVVENARDAIETSTGLNFVVKVVKEMEEEPE